MHQTVASERKGNWQFVHLNTRPSFFLFSTLYSPICLKNSWCPSCLCHSYPDAIKSSSNVQYFLQYKLYAMFSGFLWGFFVCFLYLGFFHSTRDPGKEGMWVWMAYSQMGSRVSDWEHRHHSELLCKSGQRRFAFCLQKRRSMGFGFMILLLQKCT